MEYVKLRWIGHRITAEAGVVVDHTLDLVAADDIAHEAQHALLHEVPKLAAVTIRVSPEAAPGIDPHHRIEHHEGLL